MTASYGPDRRRRFPASFLPAFLKVSLLAALLSGGLALAQEAGVDEAHVRREIERDAARALEELEGTIRADKEGAHRPLLLLLRAEALAALNEERDALEDAHSVLSEPCEERIEVEAAALVRRLRKLEVHVEAPAGTLAPGSASVAILGSARGALTLKWSLYRVDERRIRDALHAGEGLGALLRRPPAAALTTVDGGGDVVEARGAFERRIELEATHAPGVYLLQASVADVPLRASIVVARHALAARATASGLLLWCFDRTTGEPREGVPVDRVDRRGCALGATDAAGVLEVGPSRGRLLAWSEGAFVTLELDGVAAPSSAAVPLDLVLESPLVRPGGVVRALAVSPVVSSSHEVLLRDPNGEALLARSVTLDGNGLASFELPVPTAAIEGPWTLEAPGGSARFRVEGRVRPRPEPLELALPEGALTEGQPFVAHVRARGLAGAAASWELRRPGALAPLERGEGALDEDGELKIAVRALPAGPLVLEGRVQVPRAREESEAVLLPVLPSPLVMRVGPEPPLVARQGEALDLDVTLTRLDGVRAEGAALAASATVQGREVWTEARKLPSNAARLHVPLDVPGPLVLEIEAASPLGKARASREVLVVGDALPRSERARVLVDRALHRVGEAARLFARFPEERGWALVTKEKGGVRARWLERFEHGTIMKDVPVDAGDLPGVDLVVAAVGSGVIDVASARVAVVPSGSLEAAVRATATEPLAVELTASAGENPGGIGGAGSLPGSGATAATLGVLASDARVLDLLAPLAAGHGYARPAPGLFLSDALPVVVGPGREGTPAAPGFAPEESEDDPALLARARSLDLAPSVAAVVHAGEDGRASADLAISGPLRVRVVAAKEGRRASAAADVLVVPPLAVTIDLPPRLAEGDAGEVTASVTNALDVPQEVKIAWTVHGLVLEGPPRLAGSPAASGHDPEPSTLWTTLAARGRAVVTFFAKATLPGAARLEVEALGEKVRAAGVADALVFGRSVPRERTESGLLGAAPALVDASAPDEAREGSVQVEVALAPSLEAALRDAARELEARDAGDVETIAARLLAGRAAEGAGYVGTDALLSLLELQRPDGAWPSSATASALEAIASVGTPAALLASRVARGARAAERELAVAEPRERAALVLALVAAGAPPGEEIARLRARRDELDGSSRLALARALLLLGDKEGARELAAPAEPSSAASLAAELLLLARLEADKPRRAVLVQGLLACREGVSWPSPRAASLAVRALAAEAPLARARAPVRLEVHAVDADHKDLWARVGEAGSPETLRVQVPARVLARTAALELRQQGGSPVPYSVRVRWTQLVPGDAPLDRGISLQRTVARVVEQDGAVALEPLLPRGVPAGSELRVALVVGSHARDEIVVEEPLPAGVRFERAVLADGVSVEPREGRLLLRFAPCAEFTRRFAYVVRAERKGEWRALPARASLVFQPVAGESGEWVLRVRD